MNLFRLVCFIAGVLLCLLGIFTFIKNRRNKNYLYYTALIEFASFFILTLPNVYSDIPSSGLRSFESLVTSLLISLTKYFGEGYDRYNAAGSMTAFNSCYNIVLVIANILMIVFAADIILHLVDGPLQEFRFFRRRNGRVFLFSECNEKTLSIAESIGVEGKYAVIFSDSKGEMPDNLYAKIVKLDAILIPQSVEDVFNRINGRARGLEVFLFNEREEQNLQQLSVIGSSRKTKTEIKIYAEVNATPWSLYDDFITEKTKHNENLTINLVRTEENYIYNLLIEQSIFEHTVNVKDIKKINIVIAGFNDRCVEFLKAVLHLGQMPGYELSVTLVEEGDHRGYIKRIMPELSDKGGGYGDAIYSFDHIADVPFDSARLDEVFDTKCKEFTFAFVNAGDDISSINIALRINAMKYRNGITDGFKIIAGISDRNQSNKLTKKLVKNIVFDGDNSKVYNYGFITMSKIEVCTIKIHMDRYGASKTWKEYCNNEYNRHSVYARTLSFAYKVKIIDEDPSIKGNYGITNTDLKWKIYEHMRWDMYTRTLGYIKPSEMLTTDGKLSGDIRKIAKVHDCLIPFDELPEEEKQKDALEMKPQTVVALRDLLC